MVFVRLFDSPTLMESPSLLAELREAIPETSNGKPLDSKISKGDEQQ